MSPQMALRDDVLQAAVDGRLTSPEVAQTLGVELEVVERLVKELRASRRRRRSLLLLGGLCAVVLAGLVAQPALAQVTCAQTLPAPLVTFCGGAPAHASQVNGNFQAVIDLVTTKLGPITSSGVTVAGVVTTGSVTAALVSATSGSISGTLNVGGAVNSGCPITFPLQGSSVDMVDMGAYCIMRAHNADLARGAKNWLQTNEYCVSRGLRMCTFSEVSAAARLNRITTYSFTAPGDGGVTGDYWAWVDQTASDSNIAGFGGCHVQLNTNQPGYQVGDINCAVDGYLTSSVIVGLCCL